MHSLMVLNLFMLLYVATQIAVLIGKLARYDCPRNWPQFVPTLMEAVRTNDALCQQRALLAFYHVTKVLASKRLMHDRKLFEEVRRFADGNYSFSCSST